MNKLAEYIMAYSQRGACTCGRCEDALDNPEQKQPDGHVADMIFFKVSAKDGPSADELKRLIQEHVGEFCQCDLFDGKEHSYLQVGGFVGDQGLALQLMGLGTVLGMWTLLTPRSILGKDIPDDMANGMAGAGFVSVMSKPKQTSRPERTGITLTRERVIQEIKAGRKAAAFDGRDFMRLAVFFPASDLDTFGCAMKEGMKPEDKQVLDLTRENVIEVLSEDLSFAFEKALHKRGLSANAMYGVIITWLWVLDDPLQDFPEYAHYGLPLFRAVALKYGLPNPIGEDAGNEDKYAA